MPNQYMVSGHEAYNLWQRHEHAYMLAQKCDDTIAREQSLEELDKTKKIFALHIRLPSKEAQIIEDVISKIVKSGK